MCMCVAKVVGLFSVVVLGYTVCAVHVSIDLLSLLSLGYMSYCELLSLGNCIIARCWLVWYV